MTFEQNALLVLNFSYIVAIIAYRRVGFNLLYWFNTLVTQFPYSVIARGISPEAISRNTPPPRLSRLRLAMTEKSSRNDMEVGIGKGTSIRKGGSHSFNSILVPITLKKRGPGDGSLTILDVIN